MGCQDYSVRWHRSLDGDTLEGIAAMYGTSPDGIRSLNPWLEGSPPTGTWMAVRVDTPGGAAEGCDLVWHNIEEGDTLESVASAYGTTVECVSKMNPWLGSGSLDAGARLIVSVASTEPEKKPMPPRPCTRFRVSWHRVMAGDSLSSVAGRYGTTVECLQNMNPWAASTDPPAGNFMVVSIQSPVSQSCRDFRLEWHHLMPGDTLEEIAERHGTTVECLAFWHPWIDPMNLPFGCWVIAGISEGMPGPAPCARFRLMWHRIMPGETLPMLAMKYATTVECLLHLNSWVVPGSLPVGCCMLVGIQSPTSAECRRFRVRWHQIQPGDTLCAIASRYGTTVECLVCWNPWAKQGSLPVGCWIVVGISEGVVPPPTLPPPTLPPPTIPPPCTRFLVTWHQLMPGDTFFSLAQRYGTTVECLELLNPWAVPTNLPVGCWVVIRVQSPTSTNCASFTLTWHQIQPGDTLTSIASRCGTTVQCLTAWHSWVVPTNLPVGCWVVCSITESAVPPPPPPDCRRFQVTWHQLVPGDTFWQLARTYGTTVECLQRLNSWAIPTNLPVGCWVAISVQSPTSSNCNDFELTWYHIQNGDMLADVAAKLGVPVECLAAWNSWVVPTNAMPCHCWIIVGISQTSVPIPLPTPCGFNLTWHQLVAGDTFFKLAGRFNTTVECLQRFNSWADPLNLPVGCWIVVGAVSGAQMDCNMFNFRWHQIMPGDTLFALAQRFGTTVECLSTWNSWAVPTNLPVGCWLVVGRRMDP